MKMKYGKRCLALLMAGMMMNTLVVYGDEGDIPEWLNTDGTPIVEEGTEKTLRAYIRMNANSPEPEELWYYKYIENVMNINLEVTKFTDDNAAEFLALAFADGNLPDIIIDGEFTTDDLVKYGAQEGQLMDIAPYLNAANMPNLSAIYEEHPDYKHAVMDSEGHIWSLGFIADVNDRELLPRAFLNYDWLEECGLEVPETLDEFLEAMRAF